MDRSLLAAALLLAACAPAASAQAPPTMAARPVLLRLKFTPGRTLYYTAILTATLDSTRAEPGGEGLTGMGTRMLMRETVKSVRASDGAAAVEVGVDSMSMSLSGKPHPVPPALLARSKTLGTMVIRPDGHVVSFTRPAGQDLALRGADVGHTNPLDSLGFFPDAPVNIGAMWESRVPSASSAVQPLARFTLAGIETAGGKKIALIDFTTSGTTGAKFEGMKQTESGKGRLRFDIGAGTVLDQSSVSDFTTIITLRGDLKPSTDRGQEKRTLTLVPAPR